MANFAHFTISLLTIVLAIISDTTITINAPKYNPAPIKRLPLKPIIMEKIAVRTVPITDAIMFTPHSSVTSSCRFSASGCLVCFCAYSEDILIIDGNWKPINKPAGAKSAKVSPIRYWIWNPILALIISCRMI